MFGDALELDRVRLCAHPFGGPAVTLGRRILFPGATPADFSEAATARRAWLVHELVHVGQFAAAPGRTLLSWARVLLSGGYGPGLPGYRYPWPPPAWSRLNLEQQASLVEHAYLAREGGPRFGAPDAASDDAAAEAASVKRKGARPSAFAGLTPFASLD